MAQLSFSLPEGVPEDWTAFKEGVFQLYVHEIVAATAILGRPDLNPHARIVQYYARCTEFIYPLEPRIAPLKAEVARRWN